MKSELIEYFKQDIRNRFVMEIKVWRVEDRWYPHRLKFSLAFVERKTGRKVLFDNHYPKQPHLHLDDVEIPYMFLGVEQLIEDFRNHILQHFGEKV